MRTGPGRGVDHLDISGQRVVRVTGTISFNTHIVIFSRPASSLARPRTRHLFRVVGSLGGRNYKVVCVSRGVRRVLQVSSRVAMVESNGAITSQRTGRVDISRVVELVINERLAGHCPPGLGRPNYRVLDIRGLSNRRDHLHGISFGTERNRVLNITKLSNSNEARLLRAVFNTRSTSDKSVCLYNDETGGGGPTTTIGGNFTLLARRHHTGKVFNVLKVARGTATTDLGHLNTKPFMDRDETHHRASRVVGGLGIGTTDHGVTVSRLSNNGRRGIVLNE